jgi:hypothetical protein
MAKKSVSLRYNGTGSLTFQDGKGRHTVRDGDVFETDEATAELLLAGSPQVLVAVSSEPTKEDELVTLPAGAKPEPNAPEMSSASPDVSSSEADPLADAPPEGGTLPEPGPTEPASAALTGAITLADMPDSAKKSGSKSTDKDK